jgi:hypothetical protein
VRRMAKALSAATKLKISRALRGNKNAFSGGSKRKLSTREKIANINANTKAKKANLSSDQIARRQSVAKRLRAQARREEALGGGVPAQLPVNSEKVSEALAQADRLKQGALRDVKGAKSAAEVRAATAKLKEARSTLKDAMPKSTQRNASTTRVQPKAKQNLNAPQKPEESRRVDLSPAQNRRRQRSKFEADQAKARQANLGKVSEAEIRRQQNAPWGTSSNLSNAPKVLKVTDVSPDNIVVPGSRKPSRGGNDPIKMAERERKAQARREQAAKDRLYDRESAESKAARTAAQAEVMRMSQRRENPQSPQSDTGTDRAGTFTKKIPVKGEKSTRSNSPDDFSEADFEDIKLKALPEILKRLSRKVPKNDLDRMIRESGTTREELGL